MTEYTETEHNGEPARLYPDGSIRDTRGYWLTKPPGAADDITSDTAVAMVERKVAKKRQEQDDAELEVQRALVSQVAGARTPARAFGKLAGNLVAELAAESAPKEHGVRNYTSAVDWVGKRAGLIQEKVTDNRQVNIENINLSQDAEAHVAMLLERLQERLLTRENDDELP